VSSYQQKRDLLCNALAEIGYDVKKPEGSFYIFLKSPVADDVAFSRYLMAEGVLCVPGTGFGRKGYVRLSLTVTREMIERSIGAFRAAFQRLSVETEFLSSHCLEEKAVRALPA
jgi:aspartate aminotransferase